MPNERKRSIRLSAVLTGLFPASVESAAEAVRGIRACAELGFDAAEFFYDGPGTAELRRACGESGMATIFHPAYALKRQKLDLGDDDDGRRRTAVDRVRRWIDLAAGFGSEAVMLLSGAERPAGPEREAALGRLAESLAELGGHAAAAGEGGAGLDLRLESFNNAGEPWLLIGPPERCRELARLVRGRCPNFSLTMDLSHLLQMGLEPVCALVAVKEWCGHLHLANCVIRDRSHPLYGDKHPRFGLPGGELDENGLARILAGLGSAGFFEGRERPVTLGLEIITRPPDDPCAEIAAAKAAVDLALRKVEEGP